MPPRCPAGECIAAIGGKPSSTNAPLTRLAAAAAASHDLLTGQILFFPSGMQGKAAHLLKARRPVLGQQAEVALTLEHGPTRFMFTPWPRWKATTAWQISGQQGELVLGRLPLTSGSTTASRARPCFEASSRRSQSRS